MSRSLAAWLLPAASLALAGCVDGAPDAPDAPVLTVFAAASSGPALRAVAAGFVAAGHAREVRVELSGSRAVVHKLTEQGRIPDLLVSADHSLLQPLEDAARTGPVLSFATNRLVLAYNPKTPGGRALAAGERWQQVLARAAVRTGIANPELAPVGYRALLALQLNDVTAPPPLRTGATIAAKMRRRDQRPDVTKLIAPLEAGEFDAAFVYASEAHNAKLAYLELDPRVGLGEPAHEELYATVGLDPDDDGPAAAVRGASVAYGLAIPRASNQRSLAARYVERLLSPDGRALAASRGLAVYPGLTPSAVADALGEPQTPALTGASPASTSSGDPGNGRP